MQKGFRAQDSRNRTSLKSSSRGRNSAVSRRQDRSLEPAARASPPKYHPSTREHGAFSQALSEMASRLLPLRGLATDAEPGDFSDAWVPRAFESLHGIRHKAPATGSGICAQTLPASCEFAWARSISLANRVV